MDTFTAQRIDAAIHDTCTNVDAQGDGCTYVKVRKPHTCGWCGRTIEKGERARFAEGRMPVYDDEGNKQISVEYWREWWCGDYDACHRRYLDKENLCIRCEFNERKHGVLCAGCLVAAFGDLMEECPPDTPEEIDEMLRDADLDPDEVGRRAEEVARKAMEAARCTTRKN